MVPDVGTAEPVDPAAYVAMFMGRRGGALKRIVGVCGRVVRGRAPGDFTKLSFLPGRRLAWLTGPDGLGSIMGCTGVEVLQKIGKSNQPWLHEQLAKGMRFKLIVMPEARCRRADWDGIFDMVETHYPEISSKLHRRRVKLRDPSLIAKSKRNSFPMLSSRIPIMPVT